MNLKSCVLLIFYSFLQIIQASWNFRPDTSDQSLELNPKCGDPDQKRDVLFLVDASATEGSKNFRRYIMKGLLSRVVGSLPLEWEQVRVGVILYSDRIQVAVPLGRIRDRASFIRKLARIPYHNGLSRRLGDAIDKAGKIFERHSGPSTKKYLITLLDGPSTSGLSVAAGNRRLERLGIKMPAEESSAKRSVRFYDEDDEDEDEWSKRRRRRKRNADYGCVEYYLICPDCGRRRKRSTEESQELATAVLGYRTAHEGTTDYVHDFANLPNRSRDLLRYICSDF